MRQFDFILSEWKPLEDFNEGSEEIAVIFLKDHCGSSVRRGLCWGKSRGKKIHEDIPNWPG